MIRVSMREFVHHLSSYIEQASQGERIVITKRDKPLVELSDYNEHVLKPKWKRKIQKIAVRGEPFSETVIKMRQE